MSPFGHAQPGAAEELLEWRRDQALRAGVSAEQAEAIARDPRFDFHALLVLTDRGCPGELAVRILAPLDQGPEPS
jgi:hypothetical protein